MPLDEGKGEKLRSQEYRQTKNRSWPKNVVNRQPHRHARQRAISPVGQPLAGKAEAGFQNYQHGQQRPARIAQTQSGSQVVSAGSGQRHAEGITKKTRLERKVAAQVIPLDGITNGEASQPLGGKIQLHVPAIQRIAQVAEDEQFLLRILLYPAQQAVAFANLHQAAQGLFLAVEVLGQLRHGAFGFAVIIFCRRLLFVLDDMRFQLSKLRRDAIVQRPQQRFRSLFFLAVGQGFQRRHAGRGQFEQVHQISQKMGGPAHERLGIGDVHGFAQQNFPDLLMRRQDFSLLLGQS